MAQGLLGQFSGTHNELKKNVGQVNYLKVTHYNCLLDDYYDEISS